MPLKRVAIPSPNYSSRGGSSVRLIVLHTAEGATTYQSLGAFFQNPASGVSSHVGIDDTPSTVGEYVRRDYKAWTAANANPIAVQVELCAFAHWDSAEWHRHPNMLENCARWIAEEAQIFGIPVVKLSPSAAQGSGRGVCQHRDLGAWGGNHSDCGNGFPIDEVLAMAGQVPGTPTPAPSPQDGGDMIASTPSGQGYFTATYDGAVYAFGDAQYKGGAQGKVTGKIVGIACSARDGYWLLASDGGVFTFGSAKFHGRPDRV